MKKPIVLGIETSCDETSAAVVSGGTTLLSNVVSSQAKLHQRFGGVVPEVASRKHVERITLIIQEALDQAKVSPKELDAIAVTKGPGLVGSLLIGISAAKALSFAMDIPLVPVHHIVGHVYANHLIKPLTFPLVALVVSGGHTELLFMEKHNQFVRLGKTIDDAAGEAFDKVARLIGLPYPGGPEIDRLAKKGEPIYDLPRAWLEPDSLDFSFSGLKSAVIQFLQQMKRQKKKVDHRHLASSFQTAVIEVLIEKSIKAVRKKDVYQLLLAGGVSANSQLRSQLMERCRQENITMQIPPLTLCTDNAAMIAAAGTYQYLDGHVADLTLNADPNFALHTFMS